MHTKGFPNSTNIELSLSNRIAKENERPWLPAYFSCTLYRIYAATNQHSMFKTTNLMLIAYKV